MDGETQQMEAPQAEALKKAALERVSKEAHEAGFDSSKELLEAGDYDSADQYLTMKDSLKDMKEALAKTDLFALADAKTEVYKAVGMEQEAIEARIQEEFGNSLDEAKQAKQQGEDAVKTELFEAPESAKTDKIGRDASMDGFASDVFTPEQVREVVESEGGSMDIEALQLVKLEKLVRLEKKLQEASDEDKTSTALRLEKAKRELNDFIAAYPEQEADLEMNRALIKGHEDQFRLDLLVSSNAEILSRELTEELLNGESTEKLAAGTPENTMKSRYFLTMVELGNQRGVAESLSEIADLRIEALRDPASDQLPESMKNDPAILAMSKEERQAQIKQEMVIADAYDGLASKFEDKRQELKSYLEENHDMKSTIQKSGLTVDSLLNRVRASAENASVEDDEDVKAIRRSAVSQKLSAIKKKNAENAAQRKIDTIEKWNADPQAAEAAFQQREQLYDAVEAYQDEHYENYQQRLDDYNERVDEFKQDRLNREVEAERLVAKQRAENREQTPAEDLLDKINEQELELARKEKAELPENPNPGAGVDALMSRMSSRKKEVNKRAGGTVAPETPKQKAVRKNKDAKEAGFISEGFAKQMDKILMSYLLAKDELANGKKSANGEKLTVNEIKEREALLNDAEEDYIDMFGEDGVDMLREGNKRAKEVGPSEAAEELLDRIRARANGQNNGGDAAIAAK